ncbi:hypothetical protein AOLI_G00143930 [Acnodon oligacanthus]
MAVQASLKPFEARLEMGMKMKDEEKLYKRDGIFYPIIMCPPENLDALKDIEAREDDVFLAAYPKCGFNWMVAIVKKIMNASTGVTVPERPPLIEFFPPQLQQAIGKEPSRRLLGTHLPPKDIPESFKAKKTKMLVVFRNPKDTVVSYYHFMNKNPLLPKTESWDKFFSDFMDGEVPLGSYFDHALAWEKRMDDPNVVIVTYEELKENPPEGIKKVADFFSFPLTEDQVMNIAKETSFNAMAQNFKNSHGNFGNFFFRKGVVGDWKNHLSEAQSKQMDEKFQKKLAGTKLGAMMKYDYYCQ